MADLISFIDPEEVETVFRALKGTAGRFSPPFEFVEEPVPDLAGSVLMETRVNPATLILPVLLEHETDLELRQALRALAKTLDPTRGLGRLRVEFPGQPARELRCRYRSGLENHVEAPDATGFHWSKLVLEFRAFEPYWHDAADTVQDYEQPDTSLTSFFPIFPIVFQSASIFGDVAVDNQGDVDSWPVWILTGPATGLVLTNLTSGRSLDASTTLLAGETLTIDTRPGMKSVTKGDGTNLFSSLTSGSELWPLITGPQTIQISVADSTAATQLRLTYRQRYLTA